MSKNTTSTNINQLRATQRERLHEALVQHECTKDHTVADGYIDILATLKDKGNTDDYHYTVGELLLDTRFKYFATREDEFATLGDFDDYIDEQIDYTDFSIYTDDVMRYAFDHYTELDDATREPSGYSDWKSYTIALANQHYADKLHEAYRDYTTEDKVMCVLHAEYGATRVSERYLDAFVDYIDNGGDFATLADYIATSDDVDTLIYK